jgi:hypothetical protein
VDVAETVAIANLEDAGDLLRDLRALVLRLALAGAGGISPARP